MLELNEYKNQIVVKGKTLFLYFGITAMSMVIMGIRLIFDLFPFENEYSFDDFFGLIFLSIWILVVLAICLWSFTSASMRILIDDEGILCKTWFTEKKLKWFEIKDWGLSYCGYTRGEGKTYYFYFSTKQQPIKNECVKRLKGRAIKTIVFEEDYVKIVNKIIPFCSLRTEVKPFISKDKDHLI